jgi:hypothetical protein
MSAAPEPESRVRFIEHQGRRILFQDASNLVNPRDSQPVMAASKSVMATQPPASVLALLYVANTHFDKELVDALVSLAKHNKPYVKAAAIVGLSGLQRIILVTVTQLAGRRLTPFATLDEAKDWLVTQG